MKKIICFLLLFGMGIIQVHAAPETDYTPNSKSAILLDATSGEILFQKNEKEPLPPASMTKVMSMLLIMEAIDNGSLSFDDEVTISEVASAMGGSQVFLQTGEVYKVNELLKGIAIASGNDAVVAMAEKIAGSVDAFVELMNKRAHELGLVDTTFKNPHGLDAEGHVTTAHDMAMMAKELLRHPKILEYTSIYEDYLKKNDGSSIWLVNTNKLVRFYEGVDGLKTGFTSSAGYCLTSTAKKGSLRLIAVVMGVETSDKRSSDTASLLNYGFNTFKSHVIMTSNDSLGRKRIENGTKEEVELFLTEDYTKLLKQNEKTPSYSFNLNVPKLVAPLKKGDIIGTVDVVDENSKIVGTLNVTVKDDVSKNNFIESMIKNLKYITAGRKLIK